MFEVEGYFSIKVISLGANLCLLEEFDEGEIIVFIRQAKSWWSQWFLEIREWREEDVDNERLLWVREYGVPFHTCNTTFFVTLAGTIGTFVCSDERTMKVDCMDVAR